MEVIQFILYLFILICRELPYGAKSADERLVPQLAFNVLGAKNIPEPCRQATRKIPPQTDLERQIELVKERDAAALRRMKAKILPTPECRSLSHAEKESKLKEETAALVARRYAKL